MRNFMLFEAERNQDVKSMKPFEENTKVASSMFSHGMNFTYSDTHGSVSMSPFWAVAMRKLSTHSSMVGNPSKATTEEYPSKQNRKRPRNFPQHFAASARAVKSFGFTPNERITSSASSDPSSNSSPFPFFTDVA